MSITTYQAYTMAEALAAVRRDIGPDAIILHTRTFKRGGFLGIGRRTIVEVTARSSETQRVPAAASAKSAPRIRSADANAARQAYARINQANQPSSTATTPSPLSSDAPTAMDHNRTRRLAQAMAEQHDRERAGSSASGAPLTATAAEKKAASSAESAFEPRDIFQSQASPVARRFVLRPAEDSLQAEASARIPTHADMPVPSVATRASESLPLTKDAGLRPQPSRLAAAAPEPAVAVQDELAAIKDMIGEVLQRQVVTSGRPSPSMPKALFDMYLRLVSQDLSDELANRIVDQVRDELTDESLSDELAVREAVARHLAEYVPVAEGGVTPVSPDGRPFTIALVGPTGVGKTTTLAKLAATFKLRHQKKVGLITCDTYRIAAVDQLRTYASIIGLPLEVVLTPSQMRQAMQSLGGCDVILIDTAGRGPNDTGRLEELKQFIEAARPHEVHLVLSSTASEKVLLREAEAFDSVGVDKLVLTKLDEAVSFGVLINVTRQIGTKLSFVTTGQEVPNHIEPGRSMRLAELVLNGDCSSGAQSRQRSPAEVVA